MKGPLCPSWTEMRRLEASITFVMLSWGKGVSRSAY
jgi:hypothetical protein